MSELVEHTDSGKGDPQAALVHAGNGQTPDMLKMYQDIYHQLTGRTEQIRKRYSENLLIEFTEIEQLNYKICQLFAVHNLVASNISVAVFYIKDRKEQFNSFEGFKTYNANSASPTVSLVLRYNFSIIPANAKRPQEYVVNIRLTSKVALFKQIKDEAPPFINGSLLNFLTGPVVEVTVDYADYVIARGFLEAVDEWVAGCKATSSSTFLRQIQKYSHFIPEFLQISTAGVFGYCAYLVAPGIVSGADEAGNLAKFVIFFMVGLFIIIRLAWIFAKICEKAIDNFPELSYVKLNRGDEKIVDEAKKSKKYAWVRLVVGFVLTIAINCISSYVVRLI